MKKLILMIVVNLFAVSQLKAQDPLSFEKVIAVDSVKKEQIYTVIKQWFSLHSNSKEALEVDDRNTGVIVANLSEKYSKKGFAYSSYAGFIFYKVNIQVRDGRFKVTVNNFEHDTKVKSVSRLGLLTTGEYDKPSINKAFDKKVWEELKARAEQISKEMFLIYENLNYKSDNW